MGHPKIAMIESDSFIGKAERTDRYYQALYQSADSTEIEKDLYINKYVFDGNYSAMKKIMGNQTPNCCNLRKL